MLQKRFWLSALIICAFLLIVTFFWLTLQQALVPRKSTVHSIKDEQKSSDEFEKMTIKIPGAEKDAYWELHVDQGENLEDVGRLSHVEGSYFINKKLFYQLSSKTGIIYWNTRVLKMNGNVMLKTVDDSKRLNADEVVWDPTLKNVTARREVILVTPQATATANEMIANLSLDQVVFNGLTNVAYQRANHD
jgi:LPS export ABC transporter protein LptC